MSNRMTASLIFAAGGALVVLAMIVFGALGETGIESAAMIPFAAVAAAFAGYWVSREIVHVGPVMAMLFGAFGMLVAQIPFALVFSSYAAVTNGGVETFATALFVFLIAGWELAWLYQIVFGALAGLLVHRVKGGRVWDTLDADTLE